jgi:tyrosine-protein phosphatase YwqE
LVVTNAPGPPVPLYLAGARLLELFPMMPVMGNLTLRYGRFAARGISPTIAHSERKASMRLLNELGRALLDAGSMT